MTVVTCDSMQSTMYVSIWAIGSGLVQQFHESSDRQEDRFWLPKHGAEKLIESTHKADKTSISSSLSSSLLNSTAQVQKKKKTTLPVKLN